MLLQVGDYRIIGLMLDIGIEGDLFLWQLVGGKFFSHLYAASFRRCSKFFMVFMVCFLDHSFENVISKSNCAEPQNLGC